MTATSLYKLIMVELERRRCQLGLTLVDVDNLAGTQDGYTAKLMWPDTKSGKTGRWDTLQLLVDALFPVGFEVVVRQKPSAVLSEQSIRRMIYLARVPFDRKSQRELMSEYSSLSRRTSHLSPKRRQEIARKAARKRWEKPRIGNGG